MISRTPVAARALPETRGAVQRNSGLDHGSTPAAQRPAATRYVPEAMLFVQVYALTRQPHGALCDTSYESSTAADELAE